MSSRRMTSNSSPMDSLTLVNPRVQIVQSRKAAKIREAKLERPTNVVLCSGKAGNYPAAGIILAIFSSFSFSIAIFLVKVVQSADPVLFVIYRGYFQLFLFTAVAIYNRHSLVTLLDRRSVFCLFLTGIFGSVQQVTSYYAIKYIPVADATAVLLSAPVFVSIFACVLLKEKCGLFQIVTVLLAMVGVFLVCRPSFIFGANEATAKIDNGNRIIGFGLIAFGCILMAAMYISLRKAAHVPFAITNAVLAVFSIVVGVCFSLVTGKGLGQPNCGWDSVFVVSSAVLGTTGMLMFVLATQSKITTLAMAGSSNKRKMDLSEVEDWKAELESHIQSMIEESTIDKQGGIVPRFDVKSDNSTYTIKLPATKGQVYFDIQIYNYSDIKDVSASQIWEQSSRRLKFVADEDSQESKLINTLVSRIAREMREHPEKIIVPPIKRVKKN